MDEMGGVVFVDDNNCTEDIQKINFRITGSSSDSISLGVGDPVKMANSNFTI